MEMLEETKCMLAGIIASFNLISNRKSLQNDLFYDAAEIQYHILITNTANY